jgi:hypothetical protein
VELPIQSPPICRELLTTSTTLSGNAGVEPSQSVCDGLTGMAQQLCYALEYGISE